MSKKKKSLKINLDEFMKAMNSESDRANIILGAALLDSKLKDVFARRLNSFHNELLENSGPLGSFSSRIHLANALSWIDKNTTDDLNMIRKIRNDFAHDYDVKLSFQDTSVSTRCSNLKVAKAFIDNYDPMPDQPEEPRNTAKSVFDNPKWKYQLTVSFIAQQLDEIPQESCEYKGTDIIKDVSELSAKLKMKGPSKIKLITNK
jgi:hypothetical protein